MKATVVLALMALLVPPSNQKHNGESEQAARARYGTIARAVAGEAKTSTLALFLITVARHESTFARKVHTGKERGDAGRSWGLFQIMCGKSPDAVVPGTQYRAKQIVGTDEEATARAVEAAALHLRRAIKRCSGEPLCVFKTYGGISQTDEDDEVDKRLRARVATYRRLVAHTKPKKKRHAAVRHFRNEQRRPASRSVGSSSERRLRRARAPIRQK